MNQRILIELLDDEYGINEKAYDSLRRIYYDDHEMRKIFDAARNVDGRFYLPENHGLKG